MNIQGFQKMTLLDYPGKVACTIFTAGCNFRCPFCHNAALVTQIDDAAKISVQEVLAFLKTRTGLLDGVCITGGEPLLQADIEAFMLEVKRLGFLIKLDTNGAFPERLEKIIENGLIDYAAVDIKNSRKKYAQTVGLARFDAAPIDKTIALLLKGRVDFEFRTTVTAQYHSVDDISDICEWIRGADKYFLQNFVDSGNLIGQNISAHDRATLEQMLDAARTVIPNAQLRGV